MSLTQTPKRQPHHKKASGTHHRQTKHYLKAYHPYLPLLLIVIVGLAVNVFWTSLGSSHNGVLGAASSLTADQLLTDTNQARQGNNQPGLALNSKLMAAAQTKANDMVSKNYWSHDSPDGLTPWNFIQNSGYGYQEAGENLAYGFSNAEDTITGWLNSPAHRDNLLDTDYKEVGFGIVQASSFQGTGPTTVIVAMYGEPAPTNTIGATFEVPATTSYTPVRTVSRVQVLTHGEAAWSSMIISLISLVAIAWFLVRHFKVWKRVVQESEAFVIHHKFLDVLFVSTAVAGFVLTRASGFIH